MAKSKWQYLLSENLLILFLAKTYRKILNNFYLARLKRECHHVHSSGKNIGFIFGAPDHENLGDQAIANAEIEFLSAHKIDIVPIKIPTSVITSDDTFNIARELVLKNDILLGHGGGNMGIAYPQEEECRRKIIQNFPNNKIVIFPQTIYFSDTPAGKTELEASIHIYSKHKKLTLIGREKKSYKAMSDMFRSNKVLFVPDIVLSGNHSKQKMVRSGALICLRGDVEKNINNSDEKKIIDLCEKHFNPITRTDTVSSAKLFALRSKKLALKNKLIEFKSAQFVVTDRLHGMVFAAITGTPCIALSNYNHKVAGTYAWIKHLPYIKFCNTIEELGPLFAEIDFERTYVYDPSYFHKYWDQLMAAIKN